MIHDSAEHLANMQMVMPEGRNLVTFPSVARLKQGCILATIAEAIFSSTASVQLYGHSWEDNTYFVQDNEGNYGAVSFGILRTLGVLYSHESERADKTNSYSFTLMVPEAFREDAVKLVERAMPDETGEEHKPVTSVFWSDGAVISAMEPWDNIMQHGGELLRIQLLDPTDASAEWANGYGFTDDQADTLRSIWSRKMRNLSDTISLTGREKAVIGHGEYGTSWSRELLAEVGILWG